MTKAKPDLSVTVGELKLKNPLILSSGEMGRVARGLIKYAELGFAAVVSKSSTPEPWGGNPAPFNIHFPERTFFVGSQGDPNVGFKAFLPEIKKAKDVIKGSAFVVANIDPEELETTVEMAREFEKAGADALEVKTMGCPNYNPDPTKPVTSKIALHYWMQTPERTETITKAVKSAVKIPLWIKCSPKDVEDIKALEKGGANALHTVGAAGPFVRSLPIDVGTGKPILGDPTGTGIAMGPRVFKMQGLKRIADLARTTHIPLVPSGGVWEGKDVIEYIMAGAAAVQVYTSVWLKGPKWVKHILDGIEEYMIEKGISSLDEIRGVTLKYLPPIVA